MPEALLSHGGLFQPEQYYDSMISAAIPPGVNTSSSKSCHEGGKGLATALLYPKAAIELRAYL